MRALDTSGAVVGLEVLLAGEIPMPQAYVFRAEGNPLSRLRGVLGAGRSLRAPCLSYVARHPTAGLILIDTGLHPDARSDPGKEFGTPMSLVFRGLAPADQAFDEQLRGAGVRPATVQRVVMTHLHADHTSGMRLLPNATFILAREEWAAAHRRFAATSGYVHHHLPPSGRVQLLDFRREGKRHGPFTNTIDLLGDGSIRLLFTPGHTRGHLSVLLRLDGGLVVLLVGDAAYTLRSIREQRLPLLTANDASSRESLRALKAFSEQEPNAILVPTHDPDAWRALPEHGPPA